MRWIAKDRAYIQQCKQLNGNVLRYISTKNTARDMDRVRAAMGDARLNYFGFSYGTFLGSTYASLFLHRYRAMVLDGPGRRGRVRQPADGEPPGAVEPGSNSALARFFQACAADQATCGVRRQRSGRRIRAARRVRLSGPASGGVLR